MIAQDTEDQRIYKLERIFIGYHSRHLAQTLASRYEVEIEALLADTDGGAIHTLAYHRESDQYLDITGVQTFDEVQANWYGGDWTKICSPDQIPGWDTAQDTFDHPDSVLEEAISHVEALAHEAGLNLVPRHG